MGSTRKAHVPKTLSKNLKVEKTQEEIEAEKKRSEEEEKEEEELERACEQWCSKLCRIGIIVPLFFSYILYPVWEYAVRPSMVIQGQLQLFGTYAIVTGGCSGIGLRTAELLAEAGATVTVGCRDTQSQTALQALQALRKAAASWSDVAPPAVMQLQLDSLTSVRDFSAEYSQRVGKLHLLVNNAGTRLACQTTEDGIEVAFQANYLGHFLLTNLMMPLLKQNSPSRIVHVTCREGYIRPAHGWNLWFKDGWLKGWLGLPVPMTEGIRVGNAHVEPRMPSEGAGGDGDWGHEALDDEEDSEGEVAADQDAAALRRSRGTSTDWTTGCRPEKAYSNAKLAVLAFSNELERRLRESSGSEGVVSHAINPNSVATEFNNKGTPPSESTQLNYYKVMSYFPPVWISRKVFAFFYGHLSVAMLRSVDHGAKAVLHVATAEPLAGAGGGLFDDTDSSFAGCGRPAHKCGRVSRSWQPPVANDLQAGAKLWALSEDLVRER